jgi:hypothetical protein
VRNGSCNALALCLIMSMKRLSNKASYSSLAHEEATPANQHHWSHHGANVLHLVPYPSRQHNDERWCWDNCFAGTISVAGNALWWWWIDACTTH